VPELPANLDVAARLFSSRQRIAVLRSLLRDGPATRHELARRLKASPSSLQGHLAALLALEVVSTRPPMSEPGPLTREFIADIDVLRSVLVDITTDLLGR
jgi:DNA-binding transcriptional ArsR family regulator